MLNFPWEFWQLPFFASTSTQLRPEEIASCTLATLGDSAFALIAFWAVAGWAPAWVVAGSTGHACNRSVECAFPEEKERC